MHPIDALKAHKELLYAHMKVMENPEDQSTKEEIEKINQAIDFLSENGFE